VLKVRQTNIPAAAWKLKNYLNIWLCVISIHSTGHSKT
jgi:hypothetical protein